MWNETRSTEPDATPFMLRNRVWDGGYVWTTGRDGTRLLVGNEASRKVTAAAFSRRLPLRDIPAQAFRDLAALDGTESAIASFAAKHGDLWNANPPTMDLLGRVIHGPCSSFAAWQAAIDDLRFWVALWDLLSARRSKQLRSHIVFTKNGPEIAHPMGISSIGRDFIEPVDFPRNNVFKAARYALKDAVNERLNRDPVRSVLRLTQSADKEEDGFQVAFVPANLLGTLWMQFAGELSGGFHLRRCENPHCRKHFRPERKTRRFCCDVCRVDKWVQDKAGKAAGGPAAAQC